MPAFTMPLRATTRFERRLSEHINAGFRLLQVVTPEEQRAEFSIHRVALFLKQPVFVWDPLNGLALEDSSGALPALVPGWQDMPVTQQRAYTAEIREWSELFDSPETDLKAPIPLMKELLNPESTLPPHAIMVLRDLDDAYSREVLVRRALTEIAEYGVAQPTDPIRRGQIEAILRRDLFDDTEDEINVQVYRPTIILSPLEEIPPKLKHRIAVLDFDLPDAQGREEVMMGLEIGSGQQAAVAIRERLCDAGAGMTAREFENSLSLTWASRNSFTEESIADMHAEKAETVKRSGVLTFKSLAEIASVSDIGGFDHLMTYLDVRRSLYTREARLRHLDYPKGIVIAGVPGTGKSIVATMISRILELPCFMMDIGALFGSLVGETEQRWRDTRKIIDAQQGCVLVLDEVDKALGGAAQASGDSGVTRRLFGQILTWLASKQDNTFVVATLNRTEGLPPEFTRPGRFDAIFFVDLPTPLERLQILHIHLRKRGVDPTNVAVADSGGIVSENDWGTFIAQHTDKFVGAELETLVVEARTNAWSVRQSPIPTLTELIAAAHALTPLAIRDQAAVDQIRQLNLDGYARPASFTEVEIGQGHRRTVRTPSRSLR